MSDFETLGKRAERELAAERDEELERLIYEDEQKLAGESSKKKRLRREIEAESLARMERLAKTEEDFREAPDSGTGGRKTATADSATMKLFGATCLWNMECRSPPAYFQRT